MERVIINEFISQFPSSSQFTRPFSNLQVQSFYSDLFRLLSSPRALPIAAFLIKGFNSELSQNFVGIFFKLAFSDFRSFLFGKKYFEILIANFISNSDVDLQIPQSGEDSVHTYSLLDCCPHILIELLLLPSSLSHNPRSKYQLLKS